MNDPLYYPVTIQGVIWWWPVSPGSSSTINDRPLSQVPPGSRVALAGMDVTTGQEQGAVYVNGQWTYPAGWAGEQETYTYAGGGTTTTPVTTYPTDQTSAQRASTMLYNAMRGLPFISPEFLSALQAGQAPAPRTVTPQTLAALSADSTLSDAFFSVIRANALYPESYLSEIARFTPKGTAATPSFI